MSLIAYFKPRKKWKKKFKQHYNKFIEFHNRYHLKYNEEEKQQHYKVEKQTLLGDMQPYLVGNYQGILLNLGFIMFFSMTFPASSLGAAVSGLIQCHIELRAMQNYLKRDQPSPIMDIGIWMQVMESLVNGGICICMYLIIFTSNELKVFKDLYGANVTYIIAFAFLHLVFIIKYVMQAAIADEPSWIQVDREKSQRRVELVH